MKDAILPFLRAGFWGSVAGGGPFMLLTVPIAVLDRPWTEPVMNFWVAILPLAICAAFVFSALLCLGLPLTAFLSHVGRERADTYALGGAVLGALLPIPASYATGDGGAGIFFAIPGTISGLVTAMVWGRWRENLAAAQSETDPSA
jgi:hypothetical protein